MISVLYTYLILQNSSGDQSLMAVPRDMCKSLWGYPKPAWSPRLPYEKKGLYGYDTPMYAPWQTTHLLGTFHHQLHFCYASSTVNGPHRTVLDCQPCSTQNWTLLDCQPCSVHTWIALAVTIIFSHIWYKAEHYWATNHVTQNWTLLDYLPCNLLCLVNWNWLVSNYSYRIYTQLGTCILWEV